MYFTTIIIKYNHNSRTKSLTNWSNKVSLTEVIKEINMFMYNNPPKYKQGAQQSANNMYQPASGPIAKSNHHKKQ